METFKQPKRIRKTEECSRTAMTMEADVWKGTQG